MGSDNSIIDRALGVVIGSAIGDALGAPFEFKPPIADSTKIEMTGGGAFGWQPGEWTDDTSMAYVLLSVAASGVALETVDAQNTIVGLWCNWAATAPDVGVQTRNVLHRLEEPFAANARLASKLLHQKTGRTAGNGSLMRTAPVAIATLESAEATAANASAISALTHFDPDAGNACVLWCLAARDAIFTGELNIRTGLSALPPDAARYWLQLIEEAEANEPAYFSNNGWVIHAFQAAWSAVHRAVNLPAVGDDAITDRERFVAGLEFAIRAGNDTDTVAAIAGILLGARFGASAVPTRWRQVLHGWPEADERDLAKLTTKLMNLQGIG